MSDIYVNDKVKACYEVFIGIKAEEHDMCSVANEFVSLGYEKLTKFNDDDNVIVIYRKKG